MKICLSYSNVKLVPYEKKHDKKTVQWLNDKETMQQFGLTREVQEDTHRKWIDHLHDTYIWAIYDIKTEVHCGNVLLFINSKHQSAFFQIYIGDEKSRGKGIAKSALSSILDFSFLHLNLNRVWLQVFPNNLKAISVYEKLGFSKEGVERESHFFNGEFKDQLRYSLLKAEWRKKSEVLSL